MAGDDADRIAMRDSAGPRLEILAASFARLAGRPLVAVSHGGLRRARGSL